MTVDFALKIAKSMMVDMDGEQRKAYDSRQVKQSKKAKIVSGHLLNLLHTGAE